MPTPLELYIHIPFCASKCKYCDFLSFPASEEEQKAYAAALKKEITARAAVMDDYGVQSVFFGGGTPSILDTGLLCDIYDHIRHTFIMHEKAEVTLEANPCTLDMKKLKAYQKAGFNRLSIGCQSMDDKVLRIIGRRHTKEQFVDAYINARAAGFTNISCDLIFGLPEQSIGSFTRDLASLAVLAPDHISVYALQLEEGTRLYQKRRHYRFATDDEQRKMYDAARELLSRSGYEQYEISNFAKPVKRVKRKFFAFRGSIREEVEERQSVHNTGYWTGVPYLGFGLGASSYENNTRYKNTSDMDEYLQNADKPVLFQKEKTVLTKEDRIAEFLMLGLRMAKGVLEEEYFERFGEPVDVRYGRIISERVEQGFMIRDGGRIALTEKALFVSNQILADFV